MYRLTEKLPPLTRLQKILLQTKNGPIVFRNPSRSYESVAPQKESRLRRIIGVGLVGTIIISSGVLVYAKYNPKFRKQLNETVPGTGTLFRFISQGEEVRDEKVKSLTSIGTRRISPSKFDIEETIVDFKKTTSASPSLLKVNKREKEVTTVEKQNPSSVVTNKVKKKSIEPIGKVEEKVDYQKYNIPVLEKEAMNAVKQAMVGYSEAISILKDYENEIADLIEKSVQKEDHSIWFRIKERSEQKDRIIELTESKGFDAMKKIEHLELLINDLNTDLDPTDKENIKTNIKNALNDLVYTKALFTQERLTSSVFDKYSKKVDESRKLLSKELGLLFPSLIVDSESVVTDDDLDLFVLYTYQLLSFYQKEIQKLETLSKSKVEKVIEQTKAGNPEVLKELVSLESEKVRREMAQEILKKEMILRAEYEKELKHQLRRQAEVHADHLEELAALKDEEMKINLKQNVDGKVEDMRINYNRQLARVIGRMKGLDNALKEKAIAEKQAKHSQLLWNACQALISSIKYGTNTKSWEEQLKPLKNEINAISNAAVEEDPVVKVVIASIPEEASKRGVFSELALKDRFLNVEKVAYRVANLPDGYASLPKIFLSYLQSFLLIKPAHPIPPEELANEPVDINKLNNYDILCRARYWIDRGDYEQCLKYMNLLKGAARAIANDWMKETRIFLETQQAANVLLSHAVYSNLVYLETTS